MYNQPMWIFNYKDVLVVRQVTLLVRERGVWLCLWEGRQNKLIYTRVDRYELNVQRWLSTKWSVWQLCWLYWYKVSFLLTCTHLNQWHLYWTLHPCHHQALAGTCVHSCLQFWPNIYDTVHISHKSSWPAHALFVRDIDFIHPHYFSTWYKDTHILTHFVRIKCIICIYHVNHIKNTTLG